MSDTRADGRDGVAAWWLAVEDDWPAAAGTALQNRRTLRWGHLVQVVQYRRAAIPAILRADRDWPEARGFRRRHVLARLELDLSAIGDEVERTAQTLLCWTRIVEDLAPEVWVRVEGRAAGVGACLDRLGIRRAEESAGAGAAPVGGVAARQGGAAHPARGAEGGTRRLLRTLRP
jgi:hypothetical protein